MPYDLIDLKLVTAIAESGSLSRGATKLHLAASSASHRLKTLEENLNTPLFQRHPRGLTPTAAGEALLRHARTVFAQLEQMHADLAPYASGVASLVTLFANTNAINCFLPDDLAIFLNNYPQARISLEEHPSPTILQAVAGGQVDIGVVASGHTPSGILTTPYRQDRLVLIVPPQHPLAIAPIVRFRDVIGEAFVSLHAGSAIHTFLMNTAADLGCRLDIRIQVRSFHAVCRMVGAGVGIGLVPRAAAREAAQQMPDAPALVEIEESWAERDLQLCIREDNALHGMAATLFQHLAQQGQLPQPTSNVPTRKKLTWV